MHRLHNRKATNLHICQSGTSKCLGFLLNKLIKAPENSQLCPVEQTKPMFTYSIIYQMQCVYP